MVIGLIMKVRITGRRNSILRLADLYDELTMPLELRKAYQQNDIAVMKALRHTDQGDG